MNHEIVVERSTKMDARGLWQARCTCGEYSSAPGSESHARTAGAAHVAAKSADSEPLALTGVPGMDQDMITDEVVLRFRQPGEHPNHVAEWRIAPKDLLEVISSLTVVAARALRDVGKAIATGDCMTCGNQRLITMERRGRAERVDCPDCRPRYDAAVAFEQYPRLTFPKAI